MGSLKSFSEQQGFELISQSLDELSDCLDQLNGHPEYNDMLSRGLCSGGWNSCAAGAIANMRESVEALGRSLAERPAEAPENEKE